MYRTERETRTSTGGRRFAAVASIAAATVVGVTVGSAPAGAAEIMMSPAASATTATLAVNRHSVTPGQTVTFTATERDKSGTPVPGARAYLFELVGSTWKNVAEQQTSAVGKAMFTVKPSSKHAFQVDVEPVVAGGVSYAGAHTTRVTVTAEPTDIGSRIVAAAAAEKGRPYAFGAAGPRSFDCSGLVMYVFGKFGIHLPHHANSQKNYGTRVSVKGARPGDLVFVMSGSYASHVGIYAGNGMWWEAPSSGETVRLVKIWSTSVEFRHVR